MKTTTPAVSPAVIANPTPKTEPALVVPPPASKPKTFSLDLSGFDPVDLITIGEG